MMVYRCTVCNMGYATSDKAIKCCGKEKESKERKRQYKYKISFVH